MSKGTTDAQWKPGVAMPVPTKEQVTHPKRLLLSDLELHLRHYVHKPLYTSIAPRALVRAAVGRESARSARAREPAVKFWTGKREKTAHPSIAIIIGCR